MIGYSNDEKKKKKIFLNFLIKSKSKLMVKFLKNSQNNENESNLKLDKFLKTLNLNSSDVTILKYFSTGTFSQK